MNDDLNTPQAVSVLWNVLRDKEFLGLDLKNIKEEKIPKEIKGLAEKRLKAREDKDWEESDKLRDEISSKGYEIKDSKEGYIITKK